MSGSVQDRRVTWVELFFDLVFVAAVSQIGTPLARHFAFAELGRYAFLLLVAWWAWHGEAIGLVATAIGLTLGAPAILAATRAPARATLAAAVSVTASAGT
ncbi:MAG: low temperature requirement protein A [Vicinamibacterales bacterium]